MLIRVVWRVLGTAASAYWLFVLVAAAVIEDEPGVGIEGWLLVGLVLACVVGVAVAFVSEMVGD